MCTNGMQDKITTLIMAIGMRESVFGDRSVQFLLKLAVWYQW